MLLEWGSCGKIIYVDGVSAGYLTYAPPSYAPRSVAFPTSPVSADAVLLMTAHVMSEFAGGGLGRMLVQGLAKDLTRRGIKAIEAFGDNKWTQPSCVVPVDFLLSVGFKTVRPHIRYPRLGWNWKTALYPRQGRRGGARQGFFGSIWPERWLQLRAGLLPHRITISARLRTRRAAEGVSLPGRGKVPSPSHVSLPTDAGSTAAERRTRLSVT